MKYTEAWILLRIDHFKILFWDFDGVIKESLQVKTEAFSALFETSGQHTVRRIREHHLANGGMSRFEKIPLYLEWSGQERSAGRIRAVGEEFSKLVTQAVIDAPWVPGSEQFIRSNPYNQIFVVVSATPKDELEFILKALNLDRCFADAFGSPISKRDALKFTFDHSNFEPRNSLMIGDARGDLEAASQLGVPFLLRRHSTNRAFFKDYKGMSVEDMTDL